MSRIALWLSFAILVWQGAPAWAAPSAGARPAVYGGTARPDLRRELPSLRRALPNPIEHQLPALSKEEIARFRPANGLEAVGMHRAVAAEARAAGSWHDGPGGRPVWRMALRSPGAQGIRVHFTGFDAAGGRVWISDGSGDISAVAGPYSGRGPFGDGDFWSDVVPGERAILEYEPGDAGGGAVPFDLAEVAHLWTAPEAGSAAPLQAALPCHLDVSCYPEWAESAKAVARMVYEKDDGSYLCSGALVMNRTGDFTPYFLTADHCISSDTEARSLQTYWFYQTAGCNQAPPSTRDVPRALGARYLAGGAMERGDFTLLRLSEAPSGVVFAGWKADEVADGAPLAGIHHPAGDYKRFSRGSRDARDEGRAFSANNHYSVLWSEGHTEGGSSGSPIFSEPGVLVGVLSGGNKTSAGQTKCNLKPDHSYYGKLSAAFPTLREYLEGRPQVGTPGGDPGKLLASGAAQDFSYNVTAATLFSGSSGYRVTVADGATALDVRLSSSPASADVRVYLRYGTPPVVEDGRVVADASTRAESGTATLRLDARSTPALRAGTWYLGIAVMATGVPVAGRLTATVSTGSTTAPPAGNPVALVSGTSREFSIPASGTALLVNGDRGYKIDVPAGATRLEVRISSSANVDVDLLVRYGRDIEMGATGMLMDYASTAPGPNEQIAIDGRSTPPLKAGTYYIALVSYGSPAPVNGTIVATVSGSGTTPPAGPTILTSGTPQSYSLPAVTGGTLFNGSSGFRITVPEGATQLTVTVATPNANADVDLYVRFGSDVELSGSRAVSDYSSSNTGGNESVVVDARSSPPLKAGTYYIALALFTRGMAVTGTITATVERGTPPASAPTQLVSGVPRSFSLPAVTTGTLYNGNAGFRITVPEGATRLTVKAVVSTANADIDLFVRYGTDVVVSGGRAVADYTSDTPGGNETVTVDARSSPPLKAGTYYVALGLFTNNVAVTGTVSATVEAPSTTSPPDQTGTALASGTPRNISIDPVSSATLFSGSSGYRIVVPEGAAKLEIRTTGSPASADVDLYARFGTPPVVADGKVTAEFKSTGLTADELITITPQSSPPLKPGVWYIALGVFTTNTAIKVTLTATVSTDAAPAAPVVLTSGVRQPFGAPALNAPALLATNYRIAVPAGATRLTVRMDPSSTAFDMALLVRYGALPEVTASDVLADYISEGDSGTETVLITPSSSPPLKAGDYYITIASFTTGVALAGGITATVETEDTSSAPVLTSGVPREFTAGPVSTAALLSRTAAYRVVVPEGASRLQVKVATTTPGADIDLYVRFSTAPAVADSRVLADYSSTSDGGDETVTITPSSSPPLRAGVYFVTLALMTAGVEARGTVTAIVDTAPPPPSGAITLSSGVPGKFNLPAVDDATLFTGDYGFRVTVPQGATRLEVQLRTATPGVDTDLFVRHGADPNLANGEVIADYSSTSDTGNETVVITSTSSKPLKAGVYYIALALYTTGTAATGTVTATVEQAPAAPAPADGIALTSGADTGFSFDAVTAPTLFTGSSVYRIVVPAGAAKLQVRLTTATAAADLDLFVRYNTAPEVVDGRVVADHSGSSDSGDELISITPYTNPPLRAGVYYIALAVFTTGKAVRGTVTATVYGPEATYVPLPPRGWKIRSTGKVFAPEPETEVLRQDRLVYGEGAALGPKTEIGKPAAPRRVCGGGGPCF